MLHLILCLPGCPALILDTEGSYNYSGSIASSAAMHKNWLVGRIHDDIQGFQDILTFGSKERVHWDVNERNIVLDCKFALLLYRVRFSLEPSPFEA